MLSIIVTLWICAFVRRRSKKSKRKLSQKVLIESNETTDSTEPQSGEGVKPKSTRELEIHLVTDSCELLVVLLLKGKNFSCSFKILVTHEELQAHEMENVFFFAFTSVALASQIVICERWFKWKRKRLRLVRPVEKSTPVAFVHAASA